MHICCGPCLLYTFHKLRQGKFKIKGFYYNPNIYPLKEYSRRKEALEVLKEDLKFEIEYPEYQQSDYFQAVINKHGQPDRCAICWRLRLTKTAQYAKDNGFRIFSTTLLISPYQEHQLLKECGKQVAEETGLDFYYEDFRVGFKKAQEEAKVMGIYRQKYCGCKFSIKDEKQTSF